MWQTISNIKNIFDENFLSSINWVEKEWHRKNVCLFRGQNDPPKKVRQKPVFRFFFLLERFPFYIFHSAAVDIKTWAVGVQIFSTASMFGACFDFAHKIWKWKRDKTRVLALTFINRGEREKNPKTVLFVCTQVLRAESSKRCQVSSLLKGLRESRSRDYPVTRIL